MPSQQLTFLDEEFSVAIHDTGMFTVKEINRLKILQDVIDRNRQSGPLGMNNQSRGRTGD